MVEVSLRRAISRSPEEYAASDMVRVGFAGEEEPASVSAESVQVRFEKSR